MSHIIQFNNNILLKKIDAKKVVVRDVDVTKLIPVGTAVGKLFAADSTGVDSEARYLFDSNRANIYADGEVIKEEDGVFLVPIDNIDQIGPEK